MEENFVEIPLEEFHNEDLVPNTFPDGTRLVSVGSALELSNMCDELSNSEAFIVDRQVFENGAVVQYNIISVDESRMVEFWVNAYWDIKLTQAFNNREIEFTSNMDLLGDVRNGLLRSEYEIRNEFEFNNTGSTCFQLLIYSLYEPPVWSAVTVNQYWYEKLKNSVREAREKDLIPTNSDSLKVDETTSRFSGAIWYEAIKQRTITLAGVGGIGSYVGFLLGRMKPTLLIMYDPDIVEFANLSGQLYGKANIGEYKVYELAKMIKDYSDFYTMADYNERFTLDSPATDIMICGFDNMEARKMFFDVWSAHVAECTPEQRRECLFIDGRLAAEEFQVITIQGDDERALLRYKSDWLFSDAEADATVCSYKQTTFMANMIASVMVNTFVNFVANKCDPIIPRDVPFLVSYAADTMFFKVEM